MTAHRRNEFRTLLVERLQDVTMAADRVFPGRVSPIQPEELPCIVVYCRQERSEPDDDYPAAGWAGAQLRRLRVEIEATTEAFQVPEHQPMEDLFGGDAYALGDQFAEQVEQALETWDIPGFESAQFRLTETELDAPVEPGAVPIITTRLTYELMYRTPYRACSDPYVDPESGSIYREGWFPGGQVLPGCPASQTGEQCPLPDADIDPNPEFGHLTPPPEFKIPP